MEFKEACTISIIVTLLSCVSCDVSSSAPPPVSGAVTNSQPVNSPTPKPTGTPGQAGNPQATTATVPGAAANATKAVVDQNKTSPGPSKSTEKSLTRTKSPEGNATLPVSGTTKQPLVVTTTQSNKPENGSTETNDTSKPENGSTETNDTSKGNGSTEKNDTSKATSLKPTAAPTTLKSTKSPNATVIPVTNKTSSDAENKTSTTQKPDITSVSVNNKTVATQKTENTTGNTSGTTHKPASVSVSTKKPDNTPMSTKKSDITSVLPNKTVSTQKPDITTVSTRKPNSTSVSTQKPTTLSVSTQKPNSTSVSTQKPNSTSVSTQKPTSLSVSTQKPNSTSVSSQKPNSTSVSTQKPNSTSVSTQKPNSTSVSTQKPASSSVSTQKPNSTSASTQKSNSTSASTQKPATSTQKPNSSSVSTQKPVITSSQKPSTTFPPRDEFVYINEIMVDKNGGFQKVELQLSKQLDVTHYAMVMFDGTTNKKMSVVYLKDMVKQKNRLLVATFNPSQTLPSMKAQGTGVAIYDMRQMTIQDDWTVSEKGLVDALVIGKTYTDVSEHLTDILTPGVNPFILDPNKYGMSKTISRCSSEHLRSTDMFALINPSFGTDNRKKCKERLSSGSDFAIKINGIDCTLLEDENNTATKYDLTVEKLIHYIVKKVNTKCQCGVTWMHIVDPTVHCCDGASVDMRFVAPNKDQLNELKDNYRQFIDDTQHVNIASHLYQIDNTCYENCCNVPKHPKPQGGDDTAKNVKVTVAVIVSCLIVFMIVVLIVIMYMRRKKSAVYQFRMSRLDEEDDLYIDGPDQEDFVGGQEASFDISRR